MTKVPLRLIDRSDPTGRFILFPGNGLTNRATFYDYGTAEEGLEKAAKAYPGETILIMQVVAAFKPVVKLVPMGEEPDGRG